MNKSIEKRLNALAERLETIANELADQGWLEEDIETLQAQFDNRSEGWQEGEKGQKAQEVLDALQKVLDSVREVSDTAESTAQDISEAIEAAHA